MKYIGHGVVYYQGAHGYRLGISDDSTFYSVNFDAGFPPIRILIGKQNCISASVFRIMMDENLEDVEDPYKFNSDTLIDLLIDDLRKRFDIKVRLII